MPGESSRALGSSEAAQRGTTLLVSGPPMSGKRTLLFDALADRDPTDPVVVSTGMAPSGSSARSTGTR